MSEYWGKEVGMGGLGIVMGRGCWRCWRLGLVETEGSCCLGWLCCGFDGATTARGGDGGGGRSGNGGFYRDEAIACCRGGRRRRHLQLVTMAVDDASEHMGWSLRC